MNCLLHGSITLTFCKNELNKRYANKKDACLFLSLKMCKSLFIEFESEKAKGINKNVVADELKYEDYNNVLFHKSYMRHEIIRIQSKYHKIGSYRIKKSFFVFLR